LHKYLFYNQGVRESVLATNQEVARSSRAGRTIRSKEANLCGHPLLARDGDLIFWSLRRRSGHSGVQAPFRQQEGQQANGLTEKERRGVESQILPPDVPLFILKNKAQRIRSAWSKKGQPLHLEADI
jgi:hypothetical protein